MLVAVQPASRLVVTSSQLARTHYWHLSGVRLAEPDWHSSARPPRSLSTSRMTSPRRWLRGGAGGRPRRDPKTGASRFTSC